MKKLYLVALVLLICKNAMAIDPNVDPYFTPYSNENTVQPTMPPSISGEEPYSAVQIWDGWGAFTMSIGEPFFFRPAVRIGECRERASGGAAAAIVPFCALGGAFEGLLYMLRDMTVGLGDVFTGGYFRWSRKVGVFDSLK